MTTIALSFALLVVSGIYLGWRVGNKHYVERFAEDNRRIQWFPACIEALKNAEAYIAREYEIIVREIEALEASSPLGPSEYQYSGLNEARALLAQVRDVIEKAEGR